MSSFIKRCRENAGLTQEQLAEKMDVTIVAVQNWEKGRTNISFDRYYALSEVFNIPVEELIKEMLLDNDKEHPDVWPGFLFDDDTNAIIDTLHLNLAQQDLFGLMYIYDSEYLKKTVIDQDTFRDDLKHIPYGFIDRVGSIRFINQAEGLHRVVRYVKADFLMKVLRQNPLAEFNVKKLSKDNICEFIDTGYKPLNDTEEDVETYEGLNFRICMRKAKIILPVLEKIGAVHITDGRWSNPIRDDIPEEFLSCVLEMCGFTFSGWKEGYFDREYNISYILNGLRPVIEYKNIADKGEEECWMLSINEKGRELLKWLKEGRKKTT